MTLPTGTVSYTSNGQGLRQSRTTTAGTTAFLWSTNGAVPRLLDDGTNSFVYGPSNAPIAQVSDNSGTIQYLHLDLLGSTRLITSSTGAAVGSTVYDSYGKRVAHTGAADSAVGYTGNWTDPTTGLVYLRARDFDPATGQFLTVDPAINSTHQPYAYVGNNPLQLTDPLGLWSVDEGLDWLAHGLMSGPGAAVASFIEGIGDDASFGLTAQIRNAIAPGSECFVNKDGFYFAGQVTGTVASFVAGPAIFAAASRVVLGAGQAFLQANKLAQITGAAQVAGGEVAALGVAARTPVFWSGRGTQAAADEFAAANGGATLSMTALGEQAVTDTAGLAWAQAKPIWAQASAEFAESSESIAHVFQNLRGVSLDSVWAETEFPILWGNGVKIIYHLIE